MIVELGSSESLVELASDRDAARLGHTHLPGGRCTAVSGVTIAWPAFRCLMLLTTFEFSLALYDFLGPQPNAFQYLVASDRLDSGLAPFGVCQWGPKTRHKQVNWGQNYFRLVNWGKQLGSKVHVNKI